ncbi:PREDICTED: basic leucine zipper 43-like [Camelina sativa]|uniref:Basic leucine zipper 43-like n=1 Tax=Camelina sativa TaxID=90675 RepID=A0ABM1QG23_CAMSA|nr:PREDICTED: basic leucine zipper 43-like [Camelina sativa]
MMSTLPAFSFTEPGLVNQISDFQTGFTPWELDGFTDLFFSTIHHEPAVPSPCTGESDTVKINIDFNGFDESCIGSIKTNSGSDDSDIFHGVPSPTSDELDSDNTRTRINATDHNRTKLNRPVLQVTEDRKRKRMESNRESAKRSRMRKQRHIENLKEEANRLGLENRELGNRLRIVLYNMGLISTDNDRLMSEQENLRRRFLEMRQILILRQLQQNPSLIINHHQML